MPGCPVHPRVWTWLAVRYRSAAFHLAAVIASIRCTYALPRWSLYTQEPTLINRWQTETGDNYSFAVPQSSVPQDHQDELVILNSAQAAAAGLIPASAAPSQILATMDHSSQGSVRSGGDSAAEVPAPGGRVEHADTRVDMGLPHSGSATASTTAARSGPGASQQARPRSRAAAHNKPRTTTTTTARPVRRSTVAQRRAQAAAKRAASRLSESQVQRRQARKAAADAIADSRKLANTAAARRYHKPPFGMYGCAAVHPLHGSIIGGDYMASHNVAPLLAVASEKAEEAMETVEFVYPGAVMHAAAAHPTSSEQEKSWGTTRGATLAEYTHEADETLLDVAKLIVGEEYGSAAVASREQREAARANSTKVPTAAETLAAVRAAKLQVAAQKRPEEPEEDEPVPVTGVVNGTVYYGGVPLNWTGLQPPTGAAPRLLRSTHDNIFPSEEGSAVGAGAGEPASKPARGRRNFNATSAKLLRALGQARASAKPARADSSKDSAPGARKKVSSRGATQEQLRAEQQAGKPTFFERPDLPPFMSMTHSAQAVTGLRRHAAGPAMAAGQRSRASLGQRTGVRGTDSRRIAVVDPRAAQPGDDEYLQRCKQAQQAETSALASMPASMRRGFSMGVTESLIWPGAADGSDGQPAPKQSSVRAPAPPSARAAAGDKPAPAPRAPGAAAAVTAKPGAAQPASASASMAPSTIASEHSALPDGVLRVERILVDKHQKPRVYMDPDGEHAVHDAALHMDDGQVVRAQLIAPAGLNLDSLVIHTDNEDEDHAEAAHHELPAADLVAVPLQFIAAGRAAAAPALHSLTSVLPIASPGGQPALVRTAASVNAGRRMLAGHLGRRTATEKSVLGGSAVAESDSTLVMRDPRAYKHCPPSMMQGMPAAGLSSQRGVSAGDTIAQTP